MADPSVTWSGKDATFPLARVGDSQQSRPASEVCGPMSIWILISWLLFISVLP